MSFILFQPGDPTIFGLPFLTKTLLSAESSAWLQSRNLTAPCFELLSVGQVVNGPNVTAGAPASIESITLVKHVDFSSPKLYEYSLRGKTLGQGVNQPSYIYIVQTSGDQVASVVSFELREALIRDIQFQTVPDGVPTEVFKLTFTEIIWVYEVAGNGSLRAGWSVTGNRPISQFTQ